jgi:hypothetical protein
LSKTFQYVVGALGRRHGEEKRRNAGENGQHSAKHIAKSV